MGIITMSSKEVGRLDVIQRCIRKEINRPFAARFLGLSVRQIGNLKRKVRACGAAGLIHRSRGKPSHSRIPEKERTKIVILLHQYYADFKPGFAAEKLREQHGIGRDPKTIRRIMIAEGLWRPRRGKKQSGHRSWRQRRTFFGELVQFDGSYETWLEERGPEICLLAAIDDATGRVTKAMFASHEGVVPVFTFWKAYVKVHGAPRAIYLDKFSTYRMTQRVALENHELLTQFQRAAEELAIELIPANSPQAKGRVERLFGTLQDRLIKELRLARINTIVEANRFLTEVFIPRFNARFAVEPAAKGNVHRSLTGTEQRRLDAIFSRQSERTVRNDFTISFRNQWYQLTKQQPVTVRPGERLVVEERLDGLLRLRLRGKYLAHQILPERPQKIKNLPWVLPANARRHVSRYIPPPDHPWRKRFSPAALRN